MAECKKVTKREYLDFLSDNPGAKIKHVTWSFPIRVNWIVKGKLIAYRYDSCGYRAEEFYIMKKKQPKKSDYFGCVCRCKHGRTGVVYTYDKKNKVYKGVGLDGKPWQSKEPEFVINNLEDYMGYDLGT